MAEQSLPPNELADLYDALFTLFVNLPDETHPAWELAVESVVFGSDGLAPEVSSYAEQQGARNEFKIAAYRAEYGDGERVTEFPTIAVDEPRPEDRVYVDEDLKLPVAPESNEVLPLFVSDSLEKAISLLTEFPVEPEADSLGNGQTKLLDDTKFPGVSYADHADHSESTGESTGVTPNELADLYEALYVLSNELPEDAHPVWTEAIETMVHGGDALVQGADPYGKQQAKRNEVGMPEYRDAFGDGQRVTDFPTISTKEHSDHDRNGGRGIHLPVAPESGDVLPVNPPQSELDEALSLLSEFPREPEADDGNQTALPLVDTETLIDQVEIDSQSPEDDPPKIHDDGDDGDRAVDDTTQEPTHPGEDNPKTEGVLREEGPGDGALSAGVDQSKGPRTQTNRKHADPRAERAHRRAQQRNPSDVVEIGETITLALKEVNFRSQPPTVMGTKNKLVVFVEDAPQDVRELDVIRAKVVDFGGRNNSAEAVFVGYAE